jgi:hypothetical protein
VVTVENIHVMLACRSSNKPPEIYRKQALVVLAGYLLDLFFDSEDGRNMSL